MTNEMTGEENGGKIWSRNIKKSKSSALGAELLHPIKSELTAIEKDGYIPTNVCRN